MHQTSEYSHVNSTFIYLLIFLTSLMWGGFTFHLPTCHISYETAAYQCRIWWKKDGNWNLEDGFMHANSQEVTSIKNVHILRQWVSSPFHTYIHGCLSTGNLSRQTDTMSREEIHWIKAAQQVLPQLRRCHLALSPGLNLIKFRLLLTFCVSATGACREHVSHWARNKSSHWHDTICTCR